MPQQMRSGYATRFNVISHVTTYVQDSSSPNIGDDNNLALLVCPRYNASADEWQTWIEVFFLCASMSSALCKHADCICRTISRRRCFSTPLRTREAGMPRSLRRGTSAMAAHQLMEAPAIHEDRREQFWPKQFTMSATGIARCLDFGIHMDLETVRRESHYLPQAQR